MARLMRGGLRNFLWFLALLLALCIAGCNGCQGGIPPNSSTSSSGGGAGGNDQGPCGEDCSKVHTAPCSESVCNTGQVLGPLNTCVIVPAPKGTPCDDGKFCTVNDTCDEGVCKGGQPNDCGTKHSPCEAVICYEHSQTCTVTPVDDGTACTPTDLCKTNGICHLGDCNGEPKDCSFSPLNECNSVACDSHTGMCGGSPDHTKDNAPCFLTGDPCQVNKTCQSGHCQGGAPKDCSELDSGCTVGQCDSGTGICGPAHAPVGMSCTDGISDCQVGACDAKGGCKASSAPNGTACNDHDSCTSGDKCMGGNCVGGAAVPGCVLYFKEGFESCPDGWTLNGDWQCGTPENVGPPSAHTGSNCIATQIAGLYHVNQSYSACTANSPAIDLTTATNPILSFWAWDQTEGNTYDGWTLRISTDNGASFSEVTTVTPVYPLFIQNLPAWGGDHSAAGWQPYSADLTAYKGHSVILRFAFHSDGAGVYPGVYIDDVTVAEPLEDPLYITTTSPLDDMYVGVAVSIPLTRIGGTPAATWTRVSDVNADWLNVDMNTGVVSGTPTTAGPASITIRVQEPSLPSNFADKTFTFNVKEALYFTSWEGACPDGWTLTGDWQCGVPTSVGPPTAYVGTQCLGTVIGGSYSNGDQWAATTATSPDIDLGTTQGPILTFRMWLQTEQYDGAHLEVSTDGGMTYSVLTSVMPAYSSNDIDGTGIAGWEGQQQGLGWQLVQADLSAYETQTIRLRFAFYSDSSQAYPGVYIDDFFVN